MHAQPLQPPPPVVRQSALPPAVALLLQPCVQPRVFLLRLCSCRSAPDRPLLPGPAGTCSRRCRRRHVAMTVLGVKSGQLAEAGGPCVIKNICTEPYGRQLLLLGRRQLARLPGMPLGCHPRAQACMRNWRRAWWRGGQHCCLGRDWRLLAGCNINSSMPPTCWLLHWYPGMAVLLLEVS